MNIHEAAGQGDIDAVEEILKRAPSLATLQNDDGWTPLHLVAAQGLKTSPEHVAIARLLLQAGADVNARTILGWTPLHLIAINGSPESVPVLRLLLANGADVKAHANDGVTWKVFWQHGREVADILSAHERKVKQIISKSRKKHELDVETYADLRLDNQDVDPVVKQLALQCVLSHLSERVNLVPVTRLPSPGVYGFNPKGWMIFRVEGLEANRVGGGSMFVAVNKKTKEARYLYIHGE